MLLKTLVSMELLVIPSWLFAFSALAPASAPVTLPQAKIVSYGDQPGFGSGILMALRSVEVITSDGSRRKLYFIHGDRDIFLGHGPGEAYPPIGATCDFSIVSEHIASDSLGDGGPDGPLGDIIVDVRCGTNPR
ncbi:MAG: hypothetical protein JWL96_365 [Sphingomonas bacterium]|uniref:hypothetical protein n=1 Tax=Sphingomonas bacterium TaxID=1895847 RepID=UPI00262B3CDD|nr:hypothetical protein [Sphingomonas bacterium]MDB5708295.1 hypothetical protein [Sphingomonas bacterium]